MRGGQISSIKPTENNAGAVARAAYPDPTGEGKLVCVDLKAGKPLGAPVTLAALKEARAFAGSPLLTQGRLSVVPLTAAQWTCIPHPVKAPAFTWRFRA